MFNRIYTGKSSGAYIIEFPEPLILYEDKSKGIIYSNKYGIEFSNLGIYKEKLYDLVRLNIIVKYEDGILNDAKCYTQTEWEEHLNGNK